MDQVLSQQEIDALLNAMSSGTLDEQQIEDEAKEATKVKTYDFRRPTRLSKEYINTLHMVFEDFAKLGSTLLASQLRTNVNVKLAVIEQISYDEFIHSIARRTLIGLFHSDPMKGSQIVEINPQLCNILIELLCGGQEMGDSESNEDRILETRESFTDIELSILEEVVKELIKVYKQVWKDIVEIDPQLDLMDTNPQMLQSMSPNEPVILVTFTVDLMDKSTFINLCIPYIFFEGMLDKLSIRNWFDSSKEKDKDDSTELRRNLNHVEMNIEALLGNTKMDLADFLNLEVGDVIRLSKKISDPIDTYIETHPFYTTKLGKLSNGQFAVELLDKLEGEDENE
ncbi:flagellar motor switch protein FliM [Ligilactobacillus sp. WILCCON 0076]|uniref:Flagellar motor switch protein FliM n=1 Tax=Ligilactobacillus ubinensis TaxID=2876789 RepID=A0A9X2FKK7_9LACO|nr:flagellar motor switch protein FliM [Ligilactobacillus ubinensis]MCP0886223.1 flagellar motor switch protein FliM [Ligilactobacillus ubinensis]